MDAKIWKVFASLGVPGLALGVFFALSRGLGFTFSPVPSQWVGPIVVLFLATIGGITFYALHRYGPPQPKSEHLPEPLDSALSEPKQWPVTGDGQIDGVHNKLNALHATGTVSEQDLAPILRELFYRSLFFHIQEERPESALFAFCRIQLLLQRYVSFFTSSPKVRNQISYAQTRLIKLQQHLADQIYGPTFSAEKHCEMHRNSRERFIAKLPPAIKDDRDPSYVQSANEILQQLNDSLKQAGLMD